MMTIRLACVWLIACGWLFLPAYAEAVDSSSPQEQTLTIYPVTAGFSRSPSTPIARIVVVSAQTGSSVTAALASAKDVFERGGITVIEPIRRMLPGEPQGPQRRDQSPDDRYVELGLRSGADHVIMVEVTDTLVLERLSSGGATSYLHDERVTVRGIGTKTGSVILEGNARWSQPVERAGDHIRQLTAYAIARGICAPEKWVEASAANHGRGRCLR